jgi:EmrB/QacA subfamily drug resistance transporter
MSTRTKVVVMAGTLLGLFTAAMDQTIVSTSMPRIIGDLGGFGLFSWVGTSFMLTSTTTVPIVGKLSDMYGRKPFYMAGIVILLAGSALAGSSQSVEQLIAFRVVQGFGAGMIMGIAFAIVGDVFTPSERGRWAGLMSGVFASASVLGPLIGGGLTDHVDWRWVFYVNLPLGAVALGVLFFGMPNVRPPQKARLDYRGILLLVATVVPLLMALSWAGSKFDWLSLPIVALLSWAAVGLVVFTYAEFRAEEPILPMSLFKDRVFTVSGVVTLLMGFAMMGSLFYMPLLVQGVIGASATNSGLVTMPMMIAMAISSAITGQILSRVGRYRVLGVLGLSMLVLGSYMMSRMTVNSTEMDARYAMIVLGVGFGMSIPLFMYAVQNSVPYKNMGVATSSMQFLRAVGGTMGVAVMFSIIQGQYHGALEEKVPTAVTSRPDLAKELADPQFLLNVPALVRVQEAIATIPGNTEQLMSATMFGVRDALASSITDAFFIAIFVVAASVVVAMFMKDMPIRTTNQLEPEPVGEPAAAAGARAVSATGPRPSLPPIAGGAGDDLKSEGGERAPERTIDPSNS